MSDTQKQKKRLKREKRKAHTKMIQSQKGLTTEDKQKGNIGLIICCAVVLCATVIVFVNIK